MDGQSAARAKWRAQPGIEQPQEVVDFGDRPDSASGTGLARLLVNSHGRRQTSDQVNIRPRELVQELARIAGEALDVTPLPLGEDGVEGQRALSRTADPGEDDEAIARQVEVNAPKVVHSGAADGERGGRVEHPRRPCHLRESPRPPRTVLIACCQTGQSFIEFMSFVDTSVSCQVENRPPAGAPRCRDLGQLAC